VARGGRRSKDEQQAAVVQVDLPASLAVAAAATAHVNAGALKRRHQWRDAAVDAHPSPLGPT